VTRSTKLTLAALIGLGLARPLAAAEPAPLTVGPAPAISQRPAVPANQRVADSIADQLRQSGQLQKFEIDVSYQSGTAELSGIVADQSQREEALRLVQGVPGVERVLDHLTVAGGPVQQMQMLAQQQEPAPLPRKTPEPMIPPQGGPGGGPAEPVPMFGGMGGGPYDAAAPQMPPYAWPTYAPYNNLSRVAYPTCYPYNAWPYIGPNYPFPKIPVSWRKISLEWQDGHWWYGMNSNSHDWWRLRYW
jgi:hypothetical protein